MQQGGNILGTGGTTRVRGEVSGDGDDDDDKDPKKMKYFGLEDKTPKKKKPSEEKEEEYVQITSSIKKTLEETA